ncbi:hypothetical protein [Rheinheimera sp.]|uniref:hypothetical protein n=1 Tax=Rheinheimera sp. TaxID=1869214 RepID=UPI003AF6A1F3
MKNNNPIFIHSLFRTGSTYLFNVFRRSDVGYWCYQEPTHEIAFFSKDDSSILQVDHGEEKVTMLRHPAMNKGYFQELMDTWPHWQHVIKEEMIYNSYFGASSHEALGIPYWRVLIEAAAARGRPVLQECRTSNRIASIKQALGGFHIYLWRNPWDQWWSYKVASYFEHAELLIAHSEYSPTVVKTLCAELGIEAYPQGDIAGEFAFYAARPLTSEQSYLIFYLLWVLALKHANDNADVMINIDRLSDSASYREEVLQTLQNVADVSGISLADCRVPQTDYLQRDEQFFLPLESRIHELLLSHGWSSVELAQLAVVRNEFAPVRTAAASGLSAVTEQASRARELVIRFETELAHQSKVLSNTLAEQRELSSHNEAVWAAERGQLLNSLEQLQHQLNQLSEQHQSELRQLSEQCQYQLNQLSEQHQQQLAERCNDLEHALQQLQAVNLQLEQWQLRHQQLEAQVRHIELSEAKQKALVAAKGTELEKLEHKNHLLQQQLTEALVQQGVAIAQKCLIEEQKQSLETQLLSSEQARLTIAAASHQFELQLVAQTKEYELTQLRHKVARDDDLQVAEKTSRQQQDDVRQLKQELEAVQHANHYHFAEWQAVAAELAGMHATNHYHWQLAERLQQHNRELLSSWSWRITAPLRWVSDLLGRISHFCVAVIKWPLVLVLKKLMATVLASPERAARVNRWLMKDCPFVYRHLKQFALHRNLMRNPQVIISDLQTEGDRLINLGDPRLANLSPQAGAIYQALQKAIKQNKEEQ